jgi:hypothetical protein
MPAEAWPIGAYASINTRRVVLPAWTVRLLVPRHKTDAIPLYEAAFQEQLGSPLRPSLVDDLRWYFRARRSPPKGADERFDQATRAFGAPRFQALYRAWLQRGNRCWTPPCRRPWRTRWPARRASWSAMSYRIATCISFPWLAPPDAAQARKKRGKKTHDVFFRVSSYEGETEAVVEPRFCGCVGEANRFPCSVIRRRRQAAAAATGRRAMPAGNPGWYCSRDATPGSARESVPGAVWGRSPRLLSAKIVDGFGGD